LKGSHAANLSLALVLIGTPVLYYGALSSLGDPAPGVPPAEIAASRLASEVMLLAGFVALAASLWLSGYGFTAAPRRSISTLLLFIAAIIGVWFL